MNWESERFGGLKGNKWTHIVSLPKPYSFHQLFKTVCDISSLISSSAYLLPPCGEEPPNNPHLLTRILISRPLSLCTDCYMSCTQLPTTLSYYASIPTPPLKDHLERHLIQEISLCVLGILIALSSVLLSSSNHPSIYISIHTWYIINAFVYM